MFQKLAGWVYDHRKMVVAFWVMLLLATFYFALQVPKILSDPAFVAEHAESTIGERLLTERMHAPVSYLMVVIEDSDKNISKDQPFIQKLADELKQIPHVTSVTTPSKDGHLGYITVGLDVNQDQVVTMLPRFHALVDAKSTDTVKLRLSGEAAFVEAEDKASVYDLKKVEMFALPATLFVLLIAFRTWVAASLPLIVGICSASASLAILYAIGHVMHLSVFVINIPTTIGIAVGIDYSLLMVDRFREELRSQDPRTALLKTVNTSGRSIFFSAGLVMLGIFSLFFFDAVVLRSVMIAGILVIGITLLCSLTLLPALLVLFGERINRGSLFRNRSQAASTFWERFAHLVMRHPWRTMLSTLLLLAFFISPIQHARFTQPGLEALPKDYEVRQSMEKLYQTFGKPTFFPMNLLLEKTTLQASPLNDYLKWLGNQKEIVQFLPTFKEKDAQIALQLKVEPDSQETKKLIQKLRQHPVVGYQLYVTGAAVQNYDFDQEVLSHLLKAVFYVFLVTFLVLLFIFRSVLLPLKALLMNCLSLAASFGVLVWIFVLGHGLQWFHVDGASSIDTFVPIFVFAFMFGTSMDYEVFMLSRIQEEYAKGATNEEATAKGLSVTSRMITAAALVLILHTGAFSYTDVLPVKQIGLGLALSILIDATLIRILLVPSLMKLFGDWNWRIPFVTKKAL